MKKQKVKLHRKLKNFSMKSMDPIGIVLLVNNISKNNKGKHFNSYVSYESKNFIFFYEG